MPKSDVTGEDRPLRLYMPGADADPMMAALRTVEDDHSRAGRAENADTMPREEQPSPALRGRADAHRVDDLGDAVDDRVRTEDEGDRDGRGGGPHERDHAEDHSKNSADQNPPPRTDGEFDKGLGEAVDGIVKSVGGRSGC